MTISIKFKKLVPEAKLPTKGKPGDAAYDLYSVEDFTLSPGATMAVPTGLQLAYLTQEDGDDLLFLQIEGRSGIASKGVYPLGGIIDGGYRGEIKVILHNGNRIAYSEDYSYSSHEFIKKIECIKENAPKTIAFKAGDRIAQFILRRTPKDVSVEETEEVAQTERGSSGFGSTGN